MRSGKKPNLDVLTSSTVAEPPRKIRITTSKAMTTKSESQNGQLGSERAALLRYRWSPMPKRRLVVKKMRNRQTSPTVTPPSSRLCPTDRAISPNATPRRTTTPISATRARRSRACGFNVPFWIRGLLGGLHGNAHGLLGPGPNGRTLRPPAQARCRSHVADVAVRAIRSSPDKAPNNVRVPGGGKPVSTLLKVYTNEDDALLFWSVPGAIQDCRG